MPQGGIGVIVYDLCPRLGFEGCQFRGIYPNGAFDSFTYSVREDCLCILLIRGVALYIITLSR